MTDDTKERLMAAIQYTAQCIVDADRWEESLCQPIFQPGRAFHEGAKDACKRKAKERDNAIASLLSLIDRKKIITEARRNEKRRKDAEEAGNAEVYSTLKGE